MLQNVKRSNLSVVYDVCSFRWYPFITLYVRNCHPKGSLYFGLYTTCCQDPETRWNPIKSLCPGKQGISIMCG